MLLLADMASIPEGCVSGMPIALFSIAVGRHAWYFFEHPVKMLQAFKPALHRNIDKRSLLLFSLFAKKRFTKLN